MPNRDQSNGSIPSERNGWQGAMEGRTVGMHAKFRCLRTVPSEKHGNDEAARRGGGRQLYANLKVRSRSAPEGAQDG